ncbi:hypothetical protein B7494_g4629 [Chlorociboria aeruginascens]|nr:hypothetical protein B7494_g4629 [Chlorociboria aeruginascens]
MPRIPHSLLLRAYTISPLLPLVLRGTRTLPSAINELKWLREHVDETLGDSCEVGRHQKLRQLCERRSRGEPLQYILGSQPFGDLVIKCRPGVLIPRPETEAYTSFLAQCLIDSTEPTHGQKGEELPQSLSIVDLCSGSGCISLLLHSLLSHNYPHLQILGLDISKNAVALARENLRRNLRGDLKLVPVRDITLDFRVADVFNDADMIYAASRFQNCDILISNPPYISKTHFSKETARSVRNWEPKLALVPEPQSESARGEVAAEDVFYERLLHLHYHIFKSKLLLMEVGDSDQAIRVAEMAVNNGSAYYASMQINGQTYQFILDTGSSDTWIVETGFKCINVNTKAQVAPASCRFNTTFSPESGFTPIPNVNFNALYADGETLTGTYGFAEVKLGGITPIFTCMYKSGVIPPMFSIALNRPSTVSAALSMIVEPDGWIAFGGLPPVTTYGAWAISPIQYVAIGRGYIDGSLPYPQYQFYTITPDAFIYEGSTEISHDPIQWSPLPNPPNSSNVQLDSGTTLIYLPTEISLAVANLFIPPAVYNSAQGFYSVPCTARAPYFAVQIAGVPFVIDPRDMIMDFGDAGCASAISDGGSNPPYVLGDVFMKNVLVVFDVGATELRFRSR